MILGVYKSYHDKFVRKSISLKLCYFTCGSYKVPPQSKGDQWLLQPPQEVLQTAAHHVDVVYVGLQC